MKFYSNRVAALGVDIHMVAGTHMVGVMVNFQPNVQNCQNFNKNISQDTTEAVTVTIPTDTENKLNLVASVR